MTIPDFSRLILKEIEKLRISDEPKGLYEPIKYILRLEGKRIRPMLTLIGYSFFRDDPAKIAKYALSVELFHNFTLIHDDIMDNAPLRRGKETVHKKWNNTTAILSGDAMMIKAYQIIEDLEPDLLSGTFRLFNKCALEVCEGQQYDLDFENAEEVSVGDYLKMIRLKTAVLLGYSLQLGGLLARQSKETQTRLYDLGVSMGMAFQLMDDHLDTFGDESFGKKIGGDISANKKTYLLLLSLQSEFGHEVSDWLRKPKSDEKIMAMTDLYVRAGVDVQSRKKIKEYEQIALNELQSLGGDSAMKILLEDYISQLNQRIV